jgi:hypothetical protein
VVAASREADDASRRGAIVSNSTTTGTSNKVITPLV